MNRKKYLRFFLFFIMMMIMSASSAVQRFPMPEFETNYSHPDTLPPSPRSEIMLWVDVAVLVIALSLVSWMVIKKRSRKMIFYTSLLSLAYFGFYREGCVCSIGAIQNVALAIVHPGYVIPVTALLFFLLPLFFTLFFGRTFCAGVCPFGALQDLVSFSPQKMGTALKSILGLLPYLYLAFAVLFAYTGTDFIICRYDPFVGFFRFNASFGMFIFGGIILLSGVFIARPYCRFLCPYGVILNLFSRISFRHIAITPSKCIDCRLCEDSCPYEAINFPVHAKTGTVNGKVRKKFIVSVIVIPALVVITGFLGSRLNETFATVNPRVALANDISNPEIMKPGSETRAIKAFRSSGRPASEIIAEADAITDKFRTGGWLLGGFIGLVTGLTISSAFSVRYRKEYTPDKGECFSCARCTDYCPVKS